MKTMYAFAVLALMSGSANAWDVNTTCTYSRFYGNTCKTSAIADQPRDYAQEAALKSGTRSVSRPAPMTAKA